MNTKEIRREQCRTIAKLLKRHRKVDNDTVFRSGIRRLGARIFDLRAIGWKIKTDRRKNGNCFYWLKKSA